MFLKHILLRPEILSRLIFESSETGKYYVRSTNAHKARRALPEEIIRQLFVLSLIHDYQYPEKVINLEWPIQVGREKKRADVVILNDNQEPSIIIEIKVALEQDAMGQLQSYMALTGAKYGAIVTATEMICVKMDGPRNVRTIKDIPTFQAKDEVSLINTEAEQNPNPLSPLSRQIEKLPEDTQHPTPIKIERFEWDGHKNVRITIENQTLKLPYAGMDSYKKVRKEFFAAGVVLDPRIKEFQWNDLLRNQLKDNPRPILSDHMSLGSGFGKVEQEVLEAIAEHRPGFRGGWVNSIELDILLRDKRMAGVMPRIKRPDMLKVLGYVHHPYLHGGRCTSPTTTGQRPVLYIKADHVNGDITGGAAITKAYEAAQSIEEEVVPTNFQGS